MSLSLSSLWRRAEEACDAGIDALSSIASSASVPLLASAAAAARDALAPLRQPLSEGGWPRGHTVEICGRKYTVEGLLGEGGFACVYAVRREGEESHDGRRKKLFALKRVVASSKECVEGARREVAAARAAAELSSPPPPFPRAAAAAAVGLLPLLASEEKRGRTADGGKATVEILLLFPYCAGGSLADVVAAARKKKENGEEEEEGEEKERERRQQKKKREEVLSVAPLLRLFADVAEGLSRLHASKLGHFDVKPHNIFLLSKEDEEEGGGGEGGGERGEREGASPWRAALGDWGSARRIPVPLSSHAEALAVCEEAERSTTAAFRPPELWDPLHFAATAAAARPAPGRKGKEISGSADVWSLGACLYACLGDGRSPSEVAAGAGGGGSSLSLAACSGRRVDWPLGAPPSAVRALVERCLSLDPGERPSAAAFAAEARSLAEGMEEKRRTGC